MSSYGEASQVWVARQARGFRRLRPTVVTWLPPGPFAREASRGLDVIWLTEGHRERIGWRRLFFGWRGRLSWLCGLPRVNFFGASGARRRELEERMARERPAVVLAHFGPLALEMLPVTRALGIPLVAHFHGFDLSVLLRRKRYLWSLRNGLGEFAAIVVVGSHQRRWILDQGVPSERVHLIPCGVPTEEFVPKGEDGASPFRFVTACRLVPEKGVDVALEAMIRLRAAGLDVRFDVLGEGPEGPRLRARAEAAGLGDAVTFHGAVDNGRVRRVLRNARAFVQHSHSGENGSAEGFGVAVSEASATGLPVVVSDCGGLPDQVVDGETGFIVAQGDLEGMVAAMRRLVEDPALAARMGRAGRTHMVERYDTRGQVGKLEDVLIGAARPSGRSGSREEMDAGLGQDGGRGRDQERG